MYFCFIKRLINYSKVMATKFFKIGCLFFVLIAFNGCIPLGAEECDEYGTEANVSGLIKISPLQETYNVGDVITITATLPSKNNYFAIGQVDIHAETNDDNGIFSLAMWQHEGSSFPGTSLYVDNVVEFIEGGIENNTMGVFKMPYFAENDEYRIKYKVTLNRTGNYILIQDNSSNIYFQGGSTCNRYFINTDIENNNSIEDITFTVQ